MAVVTGASSGIGAATARALADEGAAVALLARRKERLDELAEDVRKRRGQALVIAADVSDPEQAKAAVARTVRELGRLDILVNNAGVMLLGPVVDAPTDEWTKMVSVNIMGLLYTAHAALPHLIRAVEDSPRKVADLVNVSSVGGRVAYALTGVYNLTKFGVVGFSESLRRELTRKHVRVSVVEPGAVTTELANNLREEVRDEAMSPFSGFEPLEPEDIADAIAYIVTRPRRVAVNEVLIRPTEQEA